MNFALSDRTRAHAYAELRALGHSRASLRAALASGALVRARKNRYVSGDAPAALRAAAEQGGRLDCVSLLRLLGVFVLREHGLHIHISKGSARLPPMGRGVTRHWRPSQHDASDLACTVVEALVQACRCQSPRESVATLDSAWHLGLVSEPEVDEVFRRLPRRFGALRPLLDPRCESGMESLLRLLLLALGCTVEVQVDIPGVGRVDFLIDGWLIVECDSRAHHSGWDAQRRDRRRDLAAAARGFTTIRPIAEDIVHDRGSVLASIRGLLDARFVGSSGQCSARFVAERSFSVV